VPTLTTINAKFLNACHSCVILITQYEYIFVINKCNIAVCDYYCGAASYHATTSYYCAACFEMNEAEIQKVCVMEKEEEETVQIFF